MRVILNDRRVHVYFFVSYEAQPGQADEPFHQGFVIPVVPLAREGTNHQLPDALHPQKTTTEPASKISEPTTLMYAYTSLATKSSKHEWCYHKELHLSGVQVAHLS